MYRQSRQALAAKASIARQQKAPEVNLTEACAHGKMEVVQQLLTEDESLLDVPGKLGRSPVLVAAVTGQSDLFQFLVRCGADLEITDDKQDNVLHLACAGGNKDIVRSVIGKHVADLEGRGRYGQTPILKAAYRGHVDVVDLLHKQGGDITAVDEGGDNLLHVACLGGNVDMVTVILDRKWADVESRGQFGQTPAMKATSMGHVDVFTLLVKYGCELGVIDSSGDTMLHMTCLSDSVDIADAIVNTSKVSIHSRGRYGRTPVMKAAEKGHIRIFDYLVSNGASVSEVDERGDTLLHIACSADSEELVDKLLACKVADIEGKGQSGRTPAMLAAYFGQRGILTLLVSRGCDLSALDDYSDTILHIACYSGNVDMLTYLMSKNIVCLESRGNHGRTPLMIAANVGHKHLFKKLVQSGCNIGAIDDEGNSVLHIACMGGSVEMVKHVLGRMKDQLESRGKNNRTPLMIAADFGHRDVFEYLAGMRAQLSMVDEFGDNIVHVACYGGDLDIVKSVLVKVQSHISLESRGKLGRTAAVKAAEKGHIRLLDFLVSRGADLSVIDSNNDNILHVTCQSGDPDMVEHIIGLKVCDLESRGMFGRTSILKAAEFGHIRALEVLVKRGGNLKVLDAYNDNILHVAVSGGHVNMVKHVLGLTLFSSSSRGKSGRTALLHAAEKGHVDVLELLIADGCSLSTLDSNGDNVLHLACGGGHLDMVQDVVSRNVAHLEARGQYGQTALMKAALFGHIRVFDWLLGKGCDVKVVDNDRYNVLHVACIGGNAAMVEHVLSLGAAEKESRGKHGRTSLLLAAVKGHVKVVELLISKGCDALVVDAVGDNILHVACLGGSMEMVQHLVQRDIIGIESRGQEGMTACMRAASVGHIDVLELLIQSGGKADVVDDGGDNILHVACLGGSVAMVKFLLSRKFASLESKGKYSQTPVMKAASMGHKGVFHLLETEGCDLTVLDRDGDNLLHVACLGGNPDLVLYLSMLTDVIDVRKKNNAGQTPAQVAEACGHTEIMNLLRP